VFEFLHSEWHLGRRRVEAPGFSPVIRRPPNHGPLGPVYAGANRLGCERCKLLRKRSDLLRRRCDVGKAPAFPGRTQDAVDPAGSLVFSLWLPEQYPTSVRATAFACATSFGRLLGVGVNFVLGTLVRSMGTLGKPVAYTAIAFGLGLPLIPFAVETRGKSLPE